MWSATDGHLDAALEGKRAHPHIDSQLLEAGWTKKAIGLVRTNAVVEQVLIDLLEWQHQAVGRDGPVQAEARGQPRPQKSALTGPTPRLLRGRRVLPGVKDQGRQLSVCVRLAAEWLNLYEWVMGR